MPTGWFFNVSSSTYRLCFFSSILSLNPVQRMIRYVWPNLQNFFQKVIAGHLRHGHVGNHQIKLIRIDSEYF